MQSDATAGFAARDYPMAVRLGNPMGEAGTPGGATSIARKHSGLPDLIPATLPNKPTDGPILGTPDSPSLPPPRPLAGAEAHLPNHLESPHGLPPRELAKVALPAYVIEPPDILLIRVRGQLLPDLTISGQHLVTPDGTVRLDVFGAVYVAGMTLEQARVAIASAISASRHVTKAIEPKDVSVDVLAYNSKVYYVITDGGGYGEQVYKFPVTGNETVLDAISNINGLPSVSSKKHIWVARRVPGHGSRDNILPVDWIGLTQGGGTATNYQVLPGDRVYVQSDKLIRIDSGLAKFLSPIERVLGTTLLGSTTYNSIKGRGQGFQ
jgi:polysaccharide export outer membrane protein